MPPSTHYLNLLNLNHADEQAQQFDFTNEDIAKELELFTNTSFLDTEPYYQQNFGGSNNFDAQLLNGQSNPAFNELNNDKLKYHTNATLPRNQHPQFQNLPNSTADSVVDGERYYDQQFDASFTSPTVNKRSADEAGLDYSVTPSSNPEEGEDKKGKTLDEEDKRRRNTAASARFRVKKKQREQALLESAKQATDRNTALETRVKELEMENKWLRSLLKPVNMEQSKNVLASL
ncbi:putative BZIP transcription factor [Taphrina deformans PYCC 5710]|uniref:BZIP transcription factor n=1 Tax=Taphrina deformans (strain PYCC 5710 / ATCC 11124 / CBS 356.35 / IMI 108563 / JCM 9778 / NBRC 8474) TaxID=1097556 RepID=R4X9M9_TAPDE|nr:putative BZIP transcription factor [Taphrina deformans PYCC 5710]|eukprot:CCG82435.1 putative BZIP transcription factor [Taphrina deformans PYCC 5710]